MLLNEFLLQLALGDEWMRVFLEEKRVGLGVVIMIFYCIGEIIIIDVMPCLVAFFLFSLLLASITSDIKLLFQQL